MKKDNIFSRSFASARNYCRPNTEDLHHLNGVGIVRNLPSYRVDGSVSHSITEIALYVMLSFLSWAGIERIKLVVPGVVNGSNANLGNILEENDDSFDEETNDAEENLVHSIVIDENKGLRVYEWEEKLLEVR